MSKTQVTSREIGFVQRNDFDIITTGQSVITKIIAGTNVTISSTGVDAGTGDVTINATAGGTAGIGRVIASINVSTTAAMLANTDYVYFTTGAITLTLPTAVGNTNSYTIVHTDTATLTIATLLSQNINFYPSAPATTATVTVRGTVINFFSDGSNWWTV